MELLPIEKIFKRLAEERSQFPRSAVDYFVQYCALTNHLRANIYKDIDAGLAANSDVSGFYTAHNSEHFDEVIIYAGKLLGIETGEEPFDKLKPYELYILLVAIRIHDAGNIHGRKDHEKKCFSVLANCGAAAGDDDMEKKMIANIAQAHGGRTVGGSKDTIGELPEQTATTKSYVPSQLIAAVVRFADEICENRARAANYLLSHGTLPKHSEIYHRYAAAIRASIVSLSDRRLVLRYVVRLEDIKSPWGCAVSGEKTENFLVDEILERLEKMDRERRYCARFVREVYRIDAIRATIEVVDEQLDKILDIPVPELSDAGYPDDGPGMLKEKLKEFCGPSLYQRLQSDSVGMEE